MTNFLDDTPTRKNESPLQAYIDRLINLDAERKSISDDMSEVVKEAKCKGYDPKALRKAFALAKLDLADRKALGDMVDELGLFG